MDTFQGTSLWLGRCSNLFDSNEITDHEVQKGELVKCNLLVIFLRFYHFGNGVVLFGLVTF